MHRRALQECAMLRESLQGYLTGRLQSTVNQTPMPPVSSVHGSQNVSPNSGQIGHQSSAIGYACNRDQSLAGVSTHTDWTSVFLNRPTPSVQPTSPPGLASMSMCGNSMIGVQSVSQVAQAQMCEGVCSVAASQPGCSVVPQMTMGSREEMRRDRVKIPKCDVHVDPNNPAKTLVDWETYVLRVG
eukprot:5868665-Amphidinium_carterae.2